MSHTYLDVPFREKDDAKALGARWDAAARKWYVPDGKELAPFNAWLPSTLKVAVPALAMDQELILSSGTPSQDMAPPRRSVSLSQLLAGVARAVADAFTSGVWTVVEVVEARTKNGHVYLELSERTPDGQVLATARASIWASTASRILPEFERATGASIAPGIKLLVRAKPVFKPQYGFSVEIDAIDPEYTLGDLEARKREIRTRLRQEGIIDANKRLPALWDFNAVLVVAPQGAAGLGDFQAEAKRLEHFGLCQFVYAHSRFQGEGAPREICQALSEALAAWRVAAGEPDAVVIIRGGGAVNDLAWLNDYELARALCTLAIPVLTGIGHERDNTILDEIAHTRFDTPSKVIAGIEQLIRKRAAEARANFEFLISHVSRGTQVSKGLLEKLFLAVQAGAARQVSAAKQTSLARINELHVRAAKTVHDAQQAIRTSVTEVRHEAHQVLSVAKQDVPALFGEIRVEACNAIATSRTLTAARLETVRDRARVDILRGRSALELAAREVTAAARRTVEDARTASTALFREVAGQGPAKTLTRGFAIVRDGNGKPVSSVTQVVSGAALELEFRDGRVATQVK